MITIYLSSSKSRIKSFAHKKRDKSKARLQKVSIFLVKNRGNTFGKNYLQIKYLYKLIHFMRGIPLIYNPGQNIMDTFEYSEFFSKILKMLLLFAPFSPKQCWECSGILGRPTSAKKTASDLKQPTHSNKS